MHSVRLCVLKGTMRILRATIGGLTSRCSAMYVLLFPVNTCNSKMRLLQQDKIVKIKNYSTMSVTDNSITIKLITV